MDIITQNPYRYLGVYSNSPTKERVANKGKMNAFLKVGKAVSFPLDLPNLLPPIDRTIETVAQAESELTLPIDQIRFAQFWWMNATHIDVIAFNHLISGDIEMAQSIWKKRGTVSSLQNLFVLSVIKNDWNTAIYYAETLYSCFSDDFIEKIVGETMPTSTPLWQMLIDSIVQEGINISSVAITNDDWKNYIAELTIAPLIDSINDAIEEAKTSKGKGAAERLKAGYLLMNSTKSALNQLRQCLPTSDIRYQTIADKLGLEILQCGIDYYNGSNAPNAARNAMELQSYALSVVVGKMAKDRCQENVDILQRIIDELPPALVFEEDRAIKEELRKFCQLPDKICYAVTLLNNTKPYLQSIKAKLGANNSYYLKISTQVVGNALHNVIEEVNAVQNIDNRYVVDSSIIIQTAISFRAAWEATKIMDTFDMEADFKTNRYNVNRNTLQSMCNQMGIPTAALSSASRSQSTATSSGSSTSRPKQTSTSSNQSSTPHNNSTNSSSNGCSGCWVALVAWIVIGVIAGAICEAVDGDFSVGFFISTMILLVVSRLFDN